MVHKPREYTEPTTHPLEEHPDYVRAIGMVSLEAVAIELRMANLLARMLGLPPRIGQAIYLTPKSETTRIEILRNAAHSRLAVSPSRKKSVLGRQMTKALADVNRICGRAQGLINLRHRMIHDEWNYSDKEKNVTRRQIDGVPGRQRVPTPKKEIDDLIEKMRVLIDDVLVLTTAFRDHPPFMANMRSDLAKSG